MLQETKEVLEDQLEGWRARSDKIHQLEKHTLMLKAQIHDLEQVIHLHPERCISHYVTSATQQSSCDPSALHFYKLGLNLC